MILILVEDLFQKDKIVLLYYDVDRAIVGSAVPAGKPLKLTGSKELATDYFAQRREISILNIGNNGTVTVDGTVHEMMNKDVLYIGRGSKEISFRSHKAADPARFYLLSYPAHHSFPTTLATRSNAAPVKTGDLKSSNARTIYKMIHTGGIPSCQLVMGYTELETGSVWNTMPPHRHERRMEVYLYFNMAPDTRVFHLMGTPDETRHIVVSNEQAVISPSWSIHSGVGTGAYTFCWGMGGENQTFEDMDGIQMDKIR